MRQRPAQCLARTKRMSSSEASIWPTFSPRSWPVMQRAIGSRARVMSCRFCRSSRHRPTKSPRWTLFSRSRTPWISWSASARSRRHSGVSTMPAVAGEAIQAAASRTTAPSNMRIANLLRYMIPRGGRTEAQMKLGVALPIVDIGGEPAAIRDFVQAAEAIGYQGIAAPDHVLGANVASRPGWTQSRGRSSDLYHDPFVLFGFLAGITNIEDFSTQVLILPQRQTVLVAKQAACLDVLSGGRFRLGIGVGWNEVEFIGLNEDFHNRGRRSEEQVEVMQALWSEPHVTVKGRWHTIDAGINPRPIQGRVPLWYGGHAEATLR